MSAALWAAALLLAPLLADPLCRRFKPAAFLGPVVLAYLAGIALANVPGLPVHPSVSRQVAEVAVPLSIPLLLFSTDVRRWFTTARGALLSFAFASASSVIATLLFGTWLGRWLDDAPRVAGMLTGTYVGGSLNLNAVGLALGAKQQTFVLLNAADLLSGGAWLLVLLSVAHPVIARVLPKWRGTGEALAAEGDAAGKPPVALGERAVALGVAAAVVAASAGLSWAVWGSVAPVATLLLITTLALGLSFVPRVRSLRGATALGDYAMLVFCVAIGSMVQLRQLEAANPLLLVMCVGVTLTAVALHVGLARLFGIDADTMLVTSTAALFGPAFIPAVARAMRNPEVIPSGVTMGLAGFAIGTYLGVAVAWVLGAG